MLATKPTQLMPHLPPPQVGAPAEVGSRPAQLLDPLLPSTPRSISGSRGARGIAGSVTNSLLVAAVHNDTKFKRWSWLLAANDGH